MRKRITSLLLTLGLLLTLVPAVGATALAAPGQDQETPLTGQLVLTGKPAYGQTLLALPKKLNTASGGLSYAWYRNGVLVPGRTTWLYTVGKEDIGAVLTVKASAQGMQGKLEASSERIEKATPVVTLKGIEPALVADGKAHILARERLIETGSAGGHGTLLFRQPDGKYTEDDLRVQNVGTYTVYFMLTETDVCKGIPPTKAGRVTVFESAEKMAQAAPASIAIFKEGGSQPIRSDSLTADTVKMQKVNYTARVYDRNGTELTDPLVYWELSSAQTPSLSISSSNPCQVITLALLANSDPGQKTLTVRCGQNGPSASIPIEVLSQSQPKVAVPTPKKLVYNGAEQVGLERGPGFLVYGTTRATHAGTYQATVVLDGGCIWEDGTTDSKQVTWTIAKADTSAPKLAAEAPAALGGAGKIKYTTAKMQMSTSADGFTGWSYCQEGETGVYPGTYYVRYWEDNDHNASPVTKVVVPAYALQTYPITVKTAKNGAVTASAWSAAPGDTVTLTASPNAGYALDTLQVVDGQNRPVKLTKQNDRHTFTMPESAVTVEALFKPVPTSGTHPFVDVPAGVYYEDAVVWAAQKGITGGTSATTFSPDLGCTRAQVVTFLWRTNGAPEAKGYLPYQDVPLDSYYAKAVLWAAREGITGGTSATTFSPNDICTRAQVVTFLWRAHGAPTPVSGYRPFMDVPAGIYYDEAVTWATENKITTGLNGPYFGPSGTCTRAQVVTFLWRDLVK